MSNHDYIAEADAAIKALNLDIRRLPFTVNDLARGIAVEYEHGRANPLTNITDDDPLMTAKIALAHLMEEKNKIMQYDYYDGLEVLEKAPSGYWRGRHLTFWRDRARIRMAAAVVCVLFVVLVLMIYVTNAGAQSCWYAPIANSLVAAIAALVYFAFTV